MYNDIIINHAEYTICTSFIIVTYMSYKKIYKHISTFKELQILCAINTGVVAAAITIPALMVVPYVLPGCIICKIIGWLWF